MNENLTYINYEKLQMKLQPLLQLMPPSYLDASATIISSDKTASPIQRCGCA